jgi:pimeloyl-ACP methyl ester carboxylesterase
MTTCVTHRPGREADDVTRLQIKPASFRAAGPVTPLLEGNPMPAIGQDHGPAAIPLLLPGFEYRRIDVDGVTISCAVKGVGPPVLMLHGYPQNHLTWRHVARALADDHTVVLADLRGYGD